MANIIHAIVIVVVSLLSLVSAINFIPQGPYILKPGIIRAANSALNITTLNIPRGGAIVKPLRPIDNSIANVNITLQVNGEACQINDPLVFIYQVTDPEGDFNATLTFPEEFFYLITCGGGPVTSLELSLLERWVIQFRWDGDRFTNTDDTC